MSRWCTRRCSSRDWGRSGFRPPRIAPTPVRRRRSRCTTRATCRGTPATSDEPRALLARVGAVVREPERSGRNPFCCGAGGGLLFEEHEEGTRISQRRFEQLQATGAGTIVTACPFCSIMLKGAQASANATTEVVDLMTFVDGRIAAGVRRRSDRGGAGAVGAGQGRERRRLAGIAPQAPRGCGHRRRRLSRLIAAARADASAGARTARASRGGRRRRAASRSSRSGTGASCRRPSTSATAASSPSPARTSTASGSRASCGASGIATARGSTSRGGRRALLQLTRDMAAGRPAAFTVDGPRGPGYQAQPGAVWLAKATGNPVVPFHVESSPCWTLRSWDRAQVPKPWSRVAIVIGAPLEVPGGCRRGGDRAEARRTRAARSSRLQRARGWQLLARSWPQSRESA